MKPKPLASLNHLTVPVSVWDIAVSPWNGRGAAWCGDSWSQGGNGCNGVVELLSTASGHNSRDLVTQPAHSSDSWLAKQMHSVDEPAGCMPTRSRRDPCAGLAAHAFAKPCEPSRRPLA